METISSLLRWIAENESVLSGVAAAIAIVAVIVALGSNGIRLIRARKQPDSDATDGKIPQEIRYCRTPSGHRIAWSSAGDGYPLVRSLGWFTNLEMEWDSPVSSAFCQKLASRFRLIRYDGRGMGLSDRDVTEFSPETRLEDLEAVIDASGVERFALMGMSEGGVTALRYAAKYPERVSHLIIWGSFLRTPTAEDVPQFAAIARLAGDYWGTDNKAFHQMFTATFLPDGNAAENRLFNDMQKESASAQVVKLFMRSIGNIDEREVAPQVHVPALVLHRKGDMAIPVTFGKEFAALLPNSRLVLMEGNNHWFVTEDEGLDRLIDHIRGFVSE
jgi:pimeloyl-ACP methyl ester carboxylesterase